MLFSREILAATRDLAAWELDAFRRIVTTRALSEQDIDEVFELLKAHIGIPSRGLVPKPIGISDLEESALGGNPLFLATITAGSGCGAVAPGTALRLGSGAGMDLIEGRNGSGKSSFARLLAASGTARVHADLLPNVFLHASKDGPATASFEVVVAGCVERIDWKEGAFSPTLSNIAVFDRICAGTYLSDGNVAEFLPGGLDVFAQLAMLRKDLKARCEAEANRMKQAAGDIPEEIDYRTTVWNVLSDWYDERETHKRLKAFASWSESDQVQFDQLSDDVASGRSATQARIRLALARSDAADALANARAALTALTDGRRTVEMASTPAVSVLATPPRSIHVPEGVLQGTGSSGWQQLWEAARCFSEQEAFEGAAFPNEIEACPLCQQRLSDGSSELLRILSQVAGAIPEPGNSTSRASVPGLTTSSLTASLSVAANMIAAAPAVEGVSRDPASEALAQISRSVSQLATQPRSSFQEQSLEDILEAIDDALGTIEALASDLERKVEAAETDLQGVPQDSGDPELLQLQARSYLRDHFDQLSARPDLLRQASALDRFVSELSVTHLTSISKKLASSVVTDRLVRMLLAQLARVGLGYLDAQVVTSTRSGTTTIRLAPPSKGFKKIEMSQILSEGEQALMGIAAFFAELEVTGHRGPVVMDDAASGLDRENQELLAKRLAEEAQDRQVVVFTHDSDFANAIREAASAIDVPLSHISMTRSGAGVGAFPP
jgi:hypothetical protein